MLDNRVELTSRDGTTKGLFQISIIAATVAVVILITASFTYLAIHEERIETEREINNTLVALLNSTRDSLMLWQDDLTFHINQLTNSPEVKNFAQATKNNSNTLTRLTNFINKNAPPNNLGFEIITPDKRVIASTDTSAIGQTSPLVEHAPGFVESATRQKNSFIAVIESHLQTPTVIVSGEITDSNNKTLGTLFIHIDSLPTFSEIASLGKAGETAQAFAFDEHGSILTRNERNSGTKSDLQTVPPITQLLHSKDNSTPLTYHTDEKYGAFLWHPMMNLGLATEINKQEAEQLYSNQNIFITASTAAIALIVASAFVITFLFNKFKIRDLERTKHQLEDIVSTRTQELLNSNEEIKNARDGLKHIIQSMPIAMVTFDNDGNILQCNRAAHELFGYAEYEFKNLKLTQLISGEEQNSYLSCNANLFNNRNGCKSFGMEILAQRASGDTFPAAITISTVDNNEGGLAVANILDISKEREQEKEKELQNRQLSQSQKMRAITQLVSGISHDFNNIITSIKGHGEIIHEAAEENDINTITKCQEVIAQSCEHAQSLTQQLLTFGRNEIESKELVAINQTVSDALQIARAAIPSSISLINRSTTESLFIETNATKLHQALLNLLLNARDALNDQGIIEVGITHEHHSGVCSSCHENFDGDYIELFVKDNGTGITPGAIQNIFEPFFTTKKTKGNGMGLPMVHGIVHGSHGHIVIKTSDHGTTFHLLFPPYQESVQPMPDNVVSHEPQEKRVMIVDDDVEITRFLEKILRNNGYQAAAYNSPLLALKDIRSNPNLYSAMIADIVMPDMQGLELSLTVSHEFPQIPVILCSGYTKLVNTSSISKYGAKAFFAKPFEVPTLIEKLQELVPDKSSPFYRM